MKKGFPQFSKSARLGEAGINLVAKVVTENFGWIFKRNHQEHDFGIDGLLELVTDDGLVTGKIIAVQVKYGSSFFKEKNKWGYIYRGDLKHFNYLSNYPTPVIIVICDPTSNSCYWKKFEVHEAQPTQSGWKLTIPFKNKLISSKAELELLAGPLVDGLSAVQEYWALNQMIIDSSIVLFVMDKSEVVGKDVSRVHAFFQRLTQTRELALELQGKIELSFYGYENDPRELFEIQEVREYVAIVDSSLPSLFFFAPTDTSSHTLKTFFYCQAHIWWEGERAIPGRRGKIGFETAELLHFFQRHWPALNSVAEWLEISLEENKKITHSVMEIFGIDTSEIDESA